MLQLGCLNAWRCPGWFVGAAHLGHWFQQPVFPWFSSIPCLLGLESPGAYSLSCLAPGLGRLHELGLASHHSVSPCSASMWLSWASSQYGSLRVIRQSSWCLPKRLFSEEVEAASLIKPRPGNRHSITSTMVLGQSSHRPAQIQGERTWNHLAVGRVPSLICYRPVLPPQKVYRAY